MYLYLYNPTNLHDLNTTANYQNYRQHTLNSSSVVTS